MRIVLLLLCFVACAAGAAKPAPAKKHDLTGVSREAIIKTVDSLRKLTKQAQDNLAKAEAETATVQKRMDDLAAELFAANREKEQQTKQKWFWLRVALSLFAVDLVLLAWIFRKPVLRMLGVPMP